MARLAVRLERSPRRPFDWTSAAAHCRIAYLRGLFLARGSLSLSAGRTHLEFVVPVAEAATLSDRLAELGLPAARRMRRGTAVVTWKRTETVVRFLQAAGASAALLELETRLVARALHGQLNRALNAETANLARVAASAARQRAAIELLAEDGRLAQEPARVRAVARARLTAPEASLAELAQETSLTRASVQRALGRLEAQAAGGGADAPGRRHGKRAALP
ncbi:MAG: DNA-binding protein WhiA [Candidatus Limnocylindrales bacterium]